MNEDKPVNRRRFFREGLRELLKPLAGAIEPLEQAANQLGALERLAPKPVPTPHIPPRSSKPEIHWLRPPGALEERAFRDTCSRCEACVKVCPAQCIKIDPTGMKGNGVPYIEADVMPCVVCDGLHCMHECPSGALQVTPLVDIDMGLAVWIAQTCIRADGEDCTVCIDTCPLGSAAIELRDAHVHVNEEGCIGCGVCQNRCPTTPKSIIVYPRSARE